MTTTSTFSGLDPQSRSSSRVLRPPGGDSNFSFGTGEETKQQSVRRHRMASNIFGIPDNEPAPASCAPETGGPQSVECGEPEDTLKTCPLGECGDAAEHMGEAEMPETAELGSEGSQAAQPVHPIAAPSRRNPPGGKSSLVLG